MSARAKIAWAGMVAGVVLLGRHAVCRAAESSAPNSANPYSVIVDRNVFRLNPPPPPPSADTGPPPDLPVINLSGFVQTANEWKVLLAVKIKSGNAASPEDISYLTMAEGERDGVVELVKIYPDKEMVDIKNSGTAMTLSMKENGFQNAPAPAPGPRGGGAGIRQIGVPLGGVQPNVPNPGVAQQVPGQLGGEGNALVVGSRGGFNNPNVAGGNVVNGSMQPQQATYAFGGNNTRTAGGVLSAGGAAYVPPPPARGPLTLPLGQNSDLSHLTQPNSTPIGNGPANPNTEMPPAPPGAQ